MMHWPLEKWSVERSADLYGVRNWGGGYFDVTASGDLAIHPFADKNVRVPIPEIIAGMENRDLTFPILLRIENILDGQISLLHETFKKTIDEFGYKDQFRGVYPVKVNQQQQVIEEISRYGERYHHGLEVGSKAELIAAMAYLRDPEACLVCNGYKDKDFIDLALYARKVGLNSIIVIEMPAELDLVLERSKALGIRPQLGVRIKVSALVGGHWAESAGDLSIFGLTTAEVVQAIETMKKADMLDCLRLLHFHLGSQIPNIRDIRVAVQEACRMYGELVREGCRMGYLDLGGGLAVDYDGSHTNFMSSRNYSLDEYCADIIETVMATLDDLEIEHPHVITESGRATVAYYSVLLFNVLDVSRPACGPVPEEIPEDYPEAIHNLLEAYKTLTVKNIQEGYNDAIFYRDEVRQLFRLGRCGLRERAVGETIFWALMKAIQDKSIEYPTPPSGLSDLDRALASVYYCNMSVFQSLPDAWAIAHLFPLMPVHRLAEQPTVKGFLADITCDCEGKIDRFIDPRGVKRVLDLHALNPGENYYLGAFLVGAYQETLGDLHNLFGDTNVVSIRIHEDGSYDFVRELEGDSVADVLSYVEYDPKEILEGFRRTAEQAVREGRLDSRERGKIMRAFEKGLRGDTYLKR